MNESTKTGAFWGLAVVLVIIAVLMARPQAVQDVNANTLIGELLFKDFNDATKAAKLKIVKFNEEQGTLSSFEVAKNRETGDWTIPSATNYPADAADQMRKAGTVFLDTEILDVVSDARDKHKDFGVLEPDDEKLEVGDEGVGMLVELQDEEGNKLVDLVVGDKVPGSENERYVRKPNQDVVYRIKLDTAPLSTEFTDWIEKDLLKINTLDINSVSLRDYAIVRDLQGAQLTRNFEADLQSEEGGKWKLAKLVTYGENGQPQEATEIPSGKELDATKLNELKNALDNLKIVSVRRKPAGLGADLKVSSTDTAALSSLQSRGFYISKGEVYSANGELLVTQKNGVQYLLRFGEIAGVGDEGDDAAKAKEADAAADATTKDKDPAGLNRYLLITAKLDESSIPPAELAVVPQTLEDWERIQTAQKKAEDEKANAGGPPAGADPNLPPLKPDDAPANPPETPAQPESPAPAEPAKPAEPSAEPAAPAAEPDAPPAAGPPAADAPKTGDAPQTSESSGSGKGEGSGAGAEARAEAQQEQPPASGDAPAEPAKPAEGDKPAEAAPPAGEEKPADAAAKPADAQPKPDAELTEDEKKERLEAEKERITRDNQRKIDERKAKLEEAQKSVRGLNGRFADWYYVVPESTYRQLRLEKDQLFRAIQPATSAPAPGGFPGGLPPGFPGFPPQQ